MKVTKKMLNRFLEIMDDYGEFVFGEEKDIQKQLEMVLNSQGYWSGNSIRVYYDNNAKDFRIESRF